MLKALKVRLKSSLASQTFSNVNEFLALDWQIAQLADTD